MRIPTGRLPALARAPSPGTTRALDPSLARAEGPAVRCLACARRCLIRPGRVGFCTAIANWQGVLNSTAYGVVGEASVTPIESKPVYHYRPGARVLSLGGLGCSLRCRFCQNWELAFRAAHDGGGLAGPNLPPERAVALAIEQGCEGLGWSHNEPSISPIYVRDCARLAREAGLFTVLVTNGLLTREALDFLGPWLDVYRVDVKSLDPAFYRQVAGTARIADLLPLAQRAREEYGLHVEAVTNLMPGLNDGDDQVARLADRLVAHLGPDTPHHLTTYVPYAFMTHIPPTPPETMQRARAIERRTGLRFVYTDDVRTPDDANTVCPECGALVIERHPGRVLARALDRTGACAGCGAHLGIVVDPA